MKKIILYIGIFIALLQNTYSQGNLSGVIDRDVFLNEETINISGNVTVKKDALLYIPHNTKLIFEGYYSITIEGKLIADGRANTPILFETKGDTTGFHNKATTDGAWAGIIFNNSEEVSEMEYCEIRYCKFIGNDTISAVSVKGNSNVSIRNLTFEDNISKNGGGAIFCSDNADVEITSCNIKNNYSENGAGAILCSGNSTILIENNTVTHNLSNTNGGAIGSINDCSPFITDNTISYNTAGNVGGAIYTEGFNATPSITANYINNNIANNGGGIYDGNINARIINNIIVNNEAIFGGGIFSGLTLSDVLIANNNICNNKAFESGGIQCSSSDMHIVNNIIYGNISENDRIKNQIGTLTAEITPTVVYNCIEGSDGSNNNISASPGFYHPTQGAGAKYDATDSFWMIDMWSPCVNAGSPESETLNLGTSDFSGDYRDSGPIDIGAYEYNFDGMVPIFANVNQSDDILIYPNPAITTLNIYHLPTENKVVSLYNIQGKLMLQSSFTERSAALDISRFSNGIYLLKIKTQDNEIIKKIIISQ